MTFNFKLLSLLALTLQNSILILLIKYTKSQPSSHFPSSLAICYVELIKFLICFFAELNKRGKMMAIGGSNIDNYYYKSPYLLLRSYWLDIYHNKWEMIKISIPALLYSIQNNLSYIAISNLNPVAYQVIYQMKILTTALFAYLLLGKKLSNRQLVSIFILMTGIVFVQLSGYFSINSPNSPNSHSSPSSPISSYQSLPSGNPWYGFMILMINSTTSGFTGIFLERLTCTFGRKRSLWMQTGEFAIFGFIFSLLFTIFSSEWSEIVKNGPFYGFCNIPSCLILLLQACGGLIVAYVIKYADNILKAFSTSISIILSSLLSKILFGERYEWPFLMGTFMVITAVYLYSREL